MSIIGDGIVLGSGGKSASIVVSGLSETDTVKAVQKIPVKVLNPEWKGLPDGYTQLEYIQNTGNASVCLINTGIYWGSISKIEYVINVVAYSTNGPMVFSGGNGKVPWICTDGNSSGINGLSNNFVNNGTSSSSFSSVSTNNPFCISGWSDDYWTGTYQYKIIRALNSSNNLIFEGIPCKRNSDSAIGLYDIVTNTFKANSGTGKFTAGKEIPQYIDGYLDGKTIVGKWMQNPNSESHGFKISPIKDYGIYAITATNGTSTVTQDVLVDVADMFSVEVTL